VTSPDTIQRCDIERGNSQTLVQSQPGGLRGPSGMFFNDSRCADQSLVRDPACPTIQIDTAGPPLDELGRPPVNVPLKQKSCAGSNATPIPAATRLTMLAICHASWAIRGLNPASSHAIRNFA